MGFFAEAVGSSWATFQPAQVPKQDDSVASKKVHASIAQGCERAETTFFFLFAELAGTVRTLYGKCSISAAGNGNFRQETERMWELTAEYRSCRLQAKLFLSIATLTSAV